MSLTRLKSLEPSLSLPSWKHCPNSFLGIAVSGSWFVCMCVQLPVNCWIFVRVGRNSFKRHLIWGETPLFKVGDITKPIKRKTGTHYISSKIKQNVPQGKGYLTSVFSPWVKNLAWKWPKMSIPPGYARPPTLGLNIDWCITVCSCQKELLPRLKNR